VLAVFPAMRLWCTVSPPIDFAMAPPNPPPPWLAVNADRSMVSVFAGDAVPLNQMPPPAPAPPRPAAWLPENVDLMIWTSPGLGPLLSK
jgi:hypothetical protein